MSGALSNNLREKFKLLRQWQIQQHEDFIKKQMEHTQIVSSQNKPVSRTQLSPETESGEAMDMVHTIMGDQEEEIRKGNISQSSADVQDENDKKTGHSGFMQRMSPSSLQRALSYALSDLETVNADDDANYDNDAHYDNDAGYDDDYGNDHISCEDDDEGDDNDEDGPNNDNQYSGSGDDRCISDVSPEDISSGMWDNSLKMQTVVFKPSRQREQAPRCDVFSEASSVAGSVNEMDGIYPIVYSEDNTSECGNPPNVGMEENADEMPISSEDEDCQETQGTEEKDIPFDELPAKSQLGNETNSFEELIKKKLILENEKANSSKSARRKNATRKPFLRKGEGIARFNGFRNAPGKSRKGASRKSSNFSSSAASLPKTSLKLIPEPKPRSFKVSDDPKASPNNEIEKLGSKNASSSSHVSTETEIEHGFNHFSRKCPIEPIKGNNMETSIREQQLEHEFQPATTESSIEASFQKMLWKSAAREKIDNDELEEFELLEEAAIDNSLSSNASVVARMLRKSPSEGVGVKHQNSTSSPRNKSKQTTELANRWEPPTSVGNQRLDALEVDVEDCEYDEDVDDEGFAASNNSSLKMMAMTSGYTNGILQTHEQDKINKNHYEFLDQSVWGDTTQQSQLTDEGEVTITESPSKESVHEAPVSQRSPPPTSNLMKQFFPNLKKAQPPLKEASKSRGPPKVDAIQNIKPTKSISQAPSHEMSSQNPSELLRSKLAELDDEITKFKDENSTLERLKLEREKELATLRKEVEEFQKQRTEELERVQTFKDEVLRKLKRERKMFEKYQKEARTIPNKKDRDEIESLKTQIGDIQDELKRRETRWNGSAARFRKRIEDLENENYELKENLRILEKERLQRWSKTDDNGQKGHRSKELNDAPRELDNVPKGLSDGARRNKSSLRMEIIPQEQPPAPRTSLVEGPSNEKPAQRLSLTPEKFNTSKVKQAMQDSEMRYPDGKVEPVLSNGSREITFPNGTRKTIDPANQNVVISFFNGDMKQILSDERIVYYYAESKTTHTTCKDGLEIFEFSNGQVEKHYPNGRKEIIFQDKTVKCIFVNGAEETVFADGTIQNLDINGDKTISFPNGQREIHTQNYKRREYPDGTSKTVYHDGRQETRYASGRLRIKDPSGNVVVDTGIS